MVFDLWLMMYDMDATPDLLNPHVVWKVYSMVNSKHCLGVWFGCPASTLSRARRSDGSGPSPLRGDTEKLRWGLPGLKGKDRERVETANRLIKMTLRLCRHCLRIGVPFYLENPLASRLWDFRGIKALAASPFVTASRYDFCQFGTPWRKATKLLCFDNPHIERGARQCKFDRAHICSATGKNMWFFQESALIFDILHLVLSLIPESSAMLLQKPFEKKLSTVICSVIRKPVHSWLWVWEAVLRIAPHSFRLAKALDVFWSCVAYAARFSL